MSIFFYKNIQNFTNTLNLDKSMVKRGGNVDLSIFRLLIMEIKYFFTLANKIVIIWINKIFNVEGLYTINFLLAVRYNYSYILMLNIRKTS